MKTPIGITEQGTFITAEDIVILKSRMDTLEDQVYRMVESIASLETTKGE